MQLPPLHSAYLLLVRYGRYVSRRLRRAKHVDLATACDRVTVQVRDLGRAWEDAAAPVQDALADRDAADDDLDEVAKTARHKLAGRSVEAAHQEPYTQVFPEGIGYYTDAPLGEEVRRYDELKLRAESHLAAIDPVRRDALPKLVEGIATFKAADASLSTARTAEKLAGDRLDAAVGHWRKELDGIHGDLIREVGKAAAERFFPRASKSSKKAPDVATPPPATNHG